MPNVNRLLLEDSTLLVQRVDGSKLWKVTAREEDGWAVEQISADNAEPRSAHYSDKALHALRSDGNLRILGPAFANLPKDRQTLLSRVRPLTPAQHETILRARLSVLRAVQQKLKKGEARNLAAAIRQVVRALPTFAQKGWGSGFYNGQKPTTEMVKEWWGWWEAASHDPRVLAPLFSKRGQHGSHITEALRAEIHTWLEEKFLIRTRPPMQIVVDDFNDRRTREVSRKTFEKVLDDDWSDFDILRLRAGENNARMTFGIFDEIAAPELPLQRVEMDHCKLDVLVPRSHGKPARPWLTAMIDACTRMIIGFHLSFDAPSFDSCRFALVHAFLPKDLEGLGLTNAWPCEGIPAQIFCDDASEFRTPEMKDAEDELGFQIKQLPGDHPWLKGKIERFFGTMQIRVLSYEEGKTFGSTKEKGDFKPTPKSTLEEIETKLLTWIVDKYHVREHDGLGEKKPLDIWRQKITQHGLQRPADRDQVVQAFRTLVKKPIGPYGVIYKNKTYSSNALKIVKKNNKIGAKYWCDVFRSDRSAIRLLDPMTMCWITLVENVPLVLDVPPPASSGASPKAGRTKPIPPPLFDDLIETGDELPDDADASAASDLLNWSAGEHFADLLAKAKAKTKISDK